MKEPSYPMPRIEYLPLEGAEHGLSCDSTDLHKSIGFKPLWILPAMALGVVGFQGMKLLLALFQQ